MPKPHEPAKYDDAIINAVKALLTYTANEGQQKTAVDWLIHQVCGYYDLSFHPEDPRMTDFAEGKRYVAAQLIKMTKLKGGNQ
jgi:hypothetical protein